MALVVENLLICRFPRCSFHSRSIAEYEAHRRSHSLPGAANPRFLQDLVSALGVRPPPVTHSPLDFQHEDLSQIYSVPTSKPYQPDSTSSTTSSQGFKCDRCSKVFTRAFTLRAHIRTHTGERPYKCEKCTRTFTRDNDRKTHQETHSRSRKFVCSGQFQGRKWGCGRPFSRARNLERHYQQKVGVRCTRSLFVAKPRTRKVPDGLPPNFVEEEDDEDQDEDGEDEDCIIIAESKRNQTWAPTDGTQGRERVPDQYRHAEQRGSEVVGDDRLTTYLNTLTDVGEYW